MRVKKYKLLAIGIPMVVVTLLNVISHFYLKDEHRPADTIKGDGASEIRPSEKEDRTQPAHL